MYVQFDEQKLQGSPKVMLVYVVEAELLPKFLSCARKYIAYAAVHLQQLAVLRQTTWWCRHKQCGQRL